MFDRETAVFALSSKSFSACCSDISMYCFWIQCFPASFILGLLEYCSCRNAQHYCLHPCNQQMWFAFGSTIEIHVFTMFSPETAACAKNLFYLLSPDPVVRLFKILIC